MGMEGKRKNNKPQQVILLMNLIPPLKWQANIMSYIASTDQNAKHERFCQVHLINCSANLSFHKSWSYASNTNPLFGRTKSIYVMRGKKSWSPHLLAFLTRYILVGLRCLVELLCMVSVVIIRAANVLPEVHWMWEVRKSAEKLIARLLEN